MDLGLQWTHWAGRFPQYFLVCWDNVDCSSRKMAKKSAIYSEFAHFLSAYCSMNQLKAPKFAIFTFSMSN